MLSLCILHTLSRSPMPKMTRYGDQYGDQYEGYDGLYRVYGVTNGEHEEQYVYQYGVVCSSIYTNMEYAQREYIHGDTDSMGSMGSMAVCSSISGDTYSTMQGIHTI